METSSFLLSWFHVVVIPNDIFPIFSYLGREKERSFSFIFLLVPSLFLSFNFFLNKTIESNFLSYFYFLFFFPLYLKPNGVLAICSFPFSIYFGSRASHRHISLEPDLNHRLVRLLDFISQFNSGRTNIQ